jgi:proteasome lid subunit RPN8/RPN11
MMLSGKQLRTIYEQCVSAYPKEAVGVLVGLGSSNHQDRILPCVNVLDELHECDPERYPCGAESGFAINPDRLLLIDAETRAKGWRMKLIYHSHTDGSTELSGADRTSAVSFDGSPLHPNVEYMVVAVKDGKVVGHAFHKWDEERKDFVTV